MQYDFLVIGGGIVGLSAAVHLLERHPHSPLLLLEKEAALATHQSGHNSGVIHAGVYYAPGSLKTEFCREGAAATVSFCREHGVRFERCGKLLVATDAAEIERMAALEQRCRANGIEVTRLSASELQRLEPGIVGAGALWVPASGIVDYAEVSRSMATLIQERGGEIRLQQRVEGIEESATQVAVSTAQGSFSARRVVVCAGLMADRLAALSGLAEDFRIVPFRGEYYRLPRHMDGIVKRLIYPIPDPRLPFLGVHLTRKLDGSVIVGPNAVLSFAREGYSKRAFNGTDTLEMLRFRGFQLLARTHLRTGLAEQWSSWCKAAYAKSCRKYCPTITAADLTPYASGVRAQAVMRDGTLVHDFLMRRTSRTLHVCNAPSPAATAAIPIGRHIAAAVSTA